MYDNNSFHYRQVLLRYQQDSGLATNYTDLITAVAAAFGEPLTASHFARFTTQALLDYVQRTHVFYLKTKLPEIGQTLHLLGNAAWSNQPLLRLLWVSFIEYTRTLEEHIHQEETFLLPYIHLLSHRTEVPGSIKSSRLSETRFSIEVFEQTHADTEGDLVKMRNIIKLYQPHHINSSLYRILLCQLENFEADLKVHAFIEDEVLISRAKQMELQLRGPFPFLTPND